MSSGSYATRVGFREDLKPNGVAACPSIADEPRGPGVLAAGCCVVCGRITVHRNADGHPQHAAERILLADLPAGYAAPGVYLASPQLAARLAELAEARA